MKLILIKIGSPEWEYMWEWLSTNPINEGLHEPKNAPNNDLMWEYMGSFTNGIKTVHEFRHLSHPIDNNIHTLTCYASPNLSQNDIEKTIS